MTGYVRAGGYDYANSYAPDGKVVRVSYGEDCPGCGGDGEVYSQNKPYPDGPCTKCGGQWDSQHIGWRRGTGTKR